MVDAADALAAAHREHWGRLLALLTRQLRSLELAEEALAEAYAKALTAWCEELPERPAAWLLTVARRHGRDLLRRQATLARKLPLLVVPDAQEVDVAFEDALESESSIPDERLRLLATCCHPALAPAARVALTLRCVAGLTTAEIARAYLVSEPTMAARLTRAKRKIAAARIPYRVQGDAELPERLSGVLTVVYLIFNEGYAASAGEAPIRHELCAEAIRLGRVLAGLMPDEAEVLGLLALMLLQHSRRDTRLDPDGGLVLLPDQDRARWDTAAIAEGISLVRRAVRRGNPGRYVLQAAIAAEHARAARADDTDWSAIAGLYADLEALTGSPVVRLNHAVAVAELAGPAAGLALLTGLDTRLDRYHLLPAVRAELLRRLGRHEEAATAYRRALELATNPADRIHLARRLEATN
ncbi:MAG: RNA polymerase sigma factor [Micromonosporaceae bacterium]